MREPKRDRGVTVSVLDLSTLEAEALEYRRKTHPDCYEVGVYGGKIAVAKSKEAGHLYAICTEGVGPEMGVTDDDPLYVEFHGSYYKRGPAYVWTDISGEVHEYPGEILPNRHSFDVIPFASATLTPEELLSYPVIEEVDLADHIRSFGARLEQNFSLWYKTLS